MIINKQNKYPVLLLTSGENTKYEDFLDPRTWSIKNGVLFGEMSGLLGLSAMAEAVTRNPLQLEMVRKHQQIIFVWTDDQNDKDIQASQAAWSQRCHLRPHGPEQRQDHQGEHLCLHGYKQGQYEQWSLQQWV